MPMDREMWGGIKGPVLGRRTWALNPGCSHCSGYLGLLHLYMGVSGALTLGDSEIVVPKSHPMICSPGLHALRMTLRGGWQRAGESPPLEQLEGGGLGSFMPFSGPSRDPGP